MAKQRAYKWVRGLLQASAFTSVMFIMQACYGTPNNDRDAELYGIEMSVRGKIVDETSQQPLQGIRVSSSDLGETVVSDENGEFDLYAISYVALDSININFSDSAGRYAEFDTLIESNSDSLNISMSQIRH